MNQNQETQELEAMEAELIAEAAAEDAREDVEFDNPAESIDIPQDGVEPLIESSQDSDVDAENLQDNDIAEKSANDETDEQINEGQEAISDTTEDNVLDTEDSSAEIEKPLSKAEKDAKRLDKSWQKQEEFKAKNIEETERLNREREEFDKQRAEFEEKSKPPSSKEYRDLSKWYEEKGEYDKAEEAKEMADIAYEKEYEALQQDKRMSAENQAKSEQEWWKTADNFVRQPENKELQDADSPIGQKVKGILESDPRLMSIPDGFEVAARVARGELAVSSLADAQKRITELETEINTLNKKTSIGNSGANLHNPSPNRKQMSIDEEMNVLLSEARREDARAGV